MEAASHKSVLRILISLFLLSAIVSYAKNPDSRDCPANDLVSDKAELQSNSVVPSSIIVGAQPALATLVVLNGNSDSGRQTIVKMGFGTGFAVNVSPEKTSWLSAFHVTGGIVDGAKLLLFLPHEPFASKNSDGVTAEIMVDAIVRHTTQVDSLWYSYERENSPLGTSSIRKKTNRCAQ
jgi:hypothetical protein